ncbi:MAG: enoyl-CoA hydratase [Enterovirga sp.]|nr:enoyl-CoA hydratase [Enterovirga sp.]
MADLLRLTVERRVATLTLDNPPVNAIGSAMLAALEATLDDLAAHPDVSVLRIRSAGRIFCAGADLKEVGSWAGSPSGPAAMAAWLKRLHAALDRLAALPMLTIAELSGSALGGGLELALACDLRLAAEGGSFGLPEVKVGLLPGAGGTQRLTTLCGIGTAKRLILTGETIGAGEALRVGLVQWAYPADAFGDAAEELAARTARLPSEALRGAKSCIAVAAPMSPAGAAAEVETVIRLLHVPDSQEALKRFLTGGSR